MNKKKKVKKIAIVGGGQLGMMLKQAASTLDIEVAVLDAKGASAHQAGAVLVEGGIKDFDAVLKLADKFGKDAPITIEVEHVAIDALQKLKDEGFTVYPDPRTLHIIADKYLQKEYLRKHKIPVADFEEIKSVKDLQRLFKKWKNGLVLKTKKGGFDGRGNVVIKDSSDLNLQKVKDMLLGGGLYAEKLFPFRKELSAILVRDVHGAIACYPIVETIHEENICSMVIAPARVSDKVKKKAEKIGHKTVSVLEGAGVFAIEMFVGQDDEILVNEIAPRVHNSGHLTIEANKTSQFENHIKAVTGQKLGDVSMVTPYAVMINILRGRGVNHLSIEKLSSQSFVHWYGKEGRMPPKDPRKIGHVTGLGDTFESAMSAAQSAFEKAMNGVIMKPSIGIIMGSDSDLVVMSEAAKILDEFEVSYELTIVSAHRTPDRMNEYAKTAQERGIKIIIAGAGGSAHLPGMTASHTTLPVIGVPIKTKNLEGLDSLLSIVQMPSGIPVATVSINGAKNAGLLALKILSINDNKIQKKLEAYQNDLKEEVLKKAKKLEQVKYKKYLTDIKR